MLLCTAAVITMQHSLLSGCAATFSLAVPACSGGTCQVWPAGSLGPAWTSGLSCRIGCKEYVFWAAAVLLPSCCLCSGPGVLLLQEGRFLPRGQVTLAFCQVCIPCWWTILGGWQSANMLEAGE